MQFFAVVLFDMGRTAKTWATIAPALDAIGLRMVTLDPATHPTAGRR